MSFKLSAPQIHYTGGFHLKDNRVYPRCSAVLVASMPPIPSSIQGNDSVEHLYGSAHK